MPTVLNLHNVSAVNLIESQRLPVGSVLVCGVHDHGLKFRVGALLEDIFSQAYSQSLETTKCVFVLALNFTVVL